MPTDTPPLLKPTRPRLARHRRGLLSGPLQRPKSMLAGRAGVAMSGHRTGQGTGRLGRGTRKARVTWPGIRGRVVSAHFSESAPTRRVHLPPKKPDDAVEPEARNPWAWLDGWYAGGKTARERAGTANRKRVSARPLGERLAGWLRPKAVKAGKGRFRPPKDTPLPIGRPRSGQVGATTMAPPRGRAGRPRRPRLSRMARAVTALTSGRSTSSALVSGEGPLPRGRGPRLGRARALAIGHGDARAPRTKAPTGRKGTVGRTRSGAISGRPTHLVTKGSKASKGTVPKPTPSPRSRGSSSWLAVGRDLPLTKEGVPRASSVRIGRARSKTAVGTVSATARRGSVRIGRARAGAVSGRNPEVRKAIGAMRRSRGTGDKASIKKTPVAIGVHRVLKAQGIKGKAAVQASVLATAIAQQTGSSSSQPTPRTRWVDKLEKYLAKHRAGAPRTTSDRWKKQFAGTAVGRTLGAKKEALRKGALSKVLSAQAKDAKARSWVSDKARGLRARVEGSAAGQKVSAWSAKSGAKVQSRLTAVRKDRRTVLGRLGDAAKAKAGKTGFGKKVSAWSSQLGSDLGRLRDAAHGRTRKGGIRSITGRTDKVMVPPVSGLAIAGGVATVAGVLGGTVPEGPAFARDVTSTRSRRGARVRDGMDAKDLDAQGRVKRTSRAARVRDRFDEEDFDGGTKLRKRQSRGARLKEKAEREEKIKKLEEAKQSLMRGDDLDEDELQETLGLGTSSKEPKEKGKDSTDQETGTDGSEGDDTTDTERSDEQGDDTVGSGTTSQTGTKGARSRRATVGSIEDLHRLGLTTGPLGKGGRPRSGSDPRALGEAARLLATGGTSLLSGKTLVGRPTPEVQVMVPTTGSKDRSDTGGDQGEGTGTPPRLGMWTPWTKGVVGKGTTRSGEAIGRGRSGAVGSRSGGTSSGQDPHDEGFWRSASPRKASGSGGGPRPSGRGRSGAILSAPRSRARRGAVSSVGLGLGMGVALGGQVVGGKGKRKAPSGKGEGSGRMASAPVRQAREALRGKGPLIDTPPPQWVPVGEDPVAFFDAVAQDLSPSEHAMLVWRLGRDNPWARLQPPPPRKGVMGLIDRLRGKRRAAPTSPRMGGRRGGKGVSGTSGVVWLGATRQDTSQDGDEVGDRTVRMDPAQVRWAREALAGEGPLAGTPIATWVPMGQPAEAFFRKVAEGLDEKGQIRLAALRKASKGGPLGGSDQVFVEGSGPASPGGARKRAGQGARTPDGKRLPAKLDGAALARAMNWEAPKGRRGPRETGTRERTATPTAGRASSRAASPPTRAALNQMGEEEIMLLLRRMVSRSPEALDLLERVEEMLDADDRLARLRELG